MRFPASSSPARRFSCNTKGARRRLRSARIFPLQDLFASACALRLTDSLSSAGGLSAAAQTQICDTVRAPSDPGLPGQSGIRCTTKSIVPAVITQRHVTVAVGISKQPPADWQGADSGTLNEPAPPQLVPAAELSTPSLDFSSLQSVVVRRREPWVAWKAARLVAEVKDNVYSVAPYWLCRCSMQGRLAAERCLLQKWLLESRRPVVSPGCRRVAASSLVSGTREVQRAERFIGSGTTTTHVRSRFGSPTLARWPGAAPANRSAAMAGRQAHRLFQWVVCAEDGQKNVAPAGLLRTVVGSSFAFDW